ncbi:MAG: diguanylate cyclase [Terracidiphilus sp.]
MMAKQKNPASDRRRTILRWAQRYGFALRLALCFVLVSAVTAFAGIDTHETPIWLANGVLLSYLLLAPRWRWPAYLCVGFAAQLVGSHEVNPHFGVGLLMSLLNVAEVFISAHLLRTRSNQLPRFTHRPYLIRFVCFAVLAAPLAIGAVAALLSAIWLGANSMHVFEGWVSSDCLGAAAATPAFVAIFMTRFRVPVRWKQNWIYPLLFVAATIVGFGQTSMPVLLLVYPLLLLVLMRLGLSWAAMATLFMAVVGSLCTALGIGPLLIMASHSFFAPNVMLQLFVAFGMCLLYAAQVVLENQKATERRLKEIAAQHALVTENTRDAIIIADFEGNRNFVSVASHNMTGWKPEEFARQKSLDLVHPEDRPKAVVVVRAMAAGSDGATIEVRIKKRDGQYMWVESSLRLIRNPATGAPSGILNIVRDITDRKIVDQSREFHLSLIRAIHGVSLTAILVVDGEGNVVSINKRFSELWKVPLAETPTGQYQKFIVPDEQLLSQCIDRVKNPEAFMQRVQELYADPGADDQCQVELKDGRTFERYSTSLRGDGGQYLGRVWFFTDITGRKIAENQLQDAYNTVEALSAMDTLTGLANRRRFNEHLAVEWRRAIRESKPLSLLLFDVDRFKSYNDTYGHLRGDSCLKEIANSAMEVVKRPGDLVARYGGDEFIIILADTDNKGAMQISNEVCAAARSRKLPHGANARGVVTVSIGCASIVPTYGQDPATLMELADRALYCAKRAGRDQVFNSEEISDDGAEVTIYGISRGKIGGTA